MITSHDKEEHLERKTNAGQVKRVSPRWMPWLISTSFFFLPSASLLSLAESPCPVIISNGAGDSEHLRLTALNKTKTPIRKIVFLCELHGKGDVKRSICPAEIGVFYPGTPYPLNLDFAPGSVHSVTV